MHRSELRADHVPVRLLALQAEINQIYENRLKLDGGFLYGILCEYLSSLSYGSSLLSTAILSVREGACMSHRSLTTVTTLTVCPLK